MKSSGETLRNNNGIECHTKKHCLTKKNVVMEEIKEKNMQIEVVKV